MTALEAADAPKRLKAICLKAMAGIPADRYESAERMAHDLWKVAARNRRLGVVAGIVGVVAILFVMWFNRPNPPPSRLSDSLVVNLTVAEEGEAGQPLAQATPIYSGDNVQVRWRVPGGYHSAAFWLDPDGELQPIEAKLLSTADDFQEYVSPDEKSGMTLVGTPGTEVVFVCARRKSPPRLEEIKPLVSNRLFPSFSSSSVLEFTNFDGVRWMDRATRSFGKPVKRADADVHEATESLRRALMSQFELVHGFAFPRLPPATEN
jgi:hypothetical protein